MELQREDLIDLLAKAEARLAAQYERDAELREAKTQIHHDIQHNNEQTARVAQTIQSLKFLISTLDFSDEEDDDDQDTVGGPLTR